MWTFISFVFIGGICTYAQSLDPERKLASSGSVTTVKFHDNEDHVTRSDLFNVITTEHGPVRGYVEDGILQFFDIPYGAFDAQKPFQDPSEPAQWTLAREVERHTARCPQLDEEQTYVGSHECLTLSIFRSSNLQNGEPSTEKADVLFHIHDSSFTFGSGDPLKYNPKNLVSKDIILVLPNYRLGPLGFLCLQNDTAPGNAGLKDLTLALKWTMNNIENFGGNSSNIVVSGAGAGGALVEYLLLSNISRTYISRAITESGFGVSPWALDRDPLDTANFLLQNISNYVENGSQELRNRVLDETDLEVIIRSAENLHFRPCVENATGFITETPWRLLQNLNFTFQYMSGSANKAAMEEALKHTEDSLLQVNNDLSLLLPNDLIFQNNEEKARIGNRIKSLYFGEKNITLTDINTLSQCYTDREYLNSGIRSARLFVKGGARVYFYEFAYDNPNLGRAFNGSIRGDSLALVFGETDQTPLSEVEERMRDIMTSLWVSFIKTGNPSTDSIGIWNNVREVPAAEEEWLSIGDEIQLEKGLHLNRLNEWHEIYQKHFIENKVDPTHSASVYILLSCFTTLAHIVVRSKF